MTCDYRWLLAVAGLMMATPALAQRSTLVPLALPEGERITCTEEELPGTEMHSGAALAGVQKRRARTYEVAISNDPFALAARTITVMSDSALPGQDQVRVRKP
jgi:hypothetical protein